MKHKEIVRLINSNSAQEQQQNKEKEGGKKVMGRKGREAPKFENDDVIDDN